MATKREAKSPELKTNAKGFVVLKHADTNAVQEFVPEAAEVWLESGWTLASEKEADQVPSPFEQAKDKKES